MGDYFPGHISIGGAIQRKLVGRLCKEIAESGASLDYGSADFEPQNADELLEAAANSGSTLDLMNDQARYGQFEDLEAFLVKHQIAFDRHSDAKYEFDAERVVFRPGMKEPKVLPASNDDNLLVQADDVLKIAKRLDASAFVDIGGVKFQAIGDSAAKLRELCGADIPPLESLRIA